MAPKDIARSCESVTLAKVDGASGALLINCCAAAVKCGVANVNELTLLRFNSGRQGNIRNRRLQVLHPNNASWAPGTQSNKV
jgi:hypothetical protein